MGLTSIQMAMARDDGNVAPVGGADEDEVASIAGGRIVVGQPVKGTTRASAMNTSNAK